MQTKDTLQIAIPVIANLENNCDVLYNIIIVEAVNIEPLQEEIPSQNVARLRSKCYNGYCTAGCLLIVIGLVLSAPVILLVCNSSNTCGYNIRGNNSTKIENYTTTDYY